MRQQMIAERLAEMAELSKMGGQTAEVLLIDNPGKDEPVGGYEAQE